MCKLCLKENEESKRSRVSHCLNISIYLELYCWSEGEGWVVKPGSDSGNQYNMKKYNT